MKRDCCPQSSEGNIPDRKQGLLLNNPLLTVVLAAKDARQADMHLCLASFAALQNAGRLEMLVVRSGSMPNLIREVTDAFSDCRVIEVPPEGIYAAYNAGIINARGLHVLFFGVDDVALPGMDRVIDELAQSPGHYHLFAAACYMQALGVRAPSRSRLSLIMKNWCHQGIFYLRSYLLQHPYERLYPVCADHKMNIDIVSDRTLVFGISNELVAYFSAGGVSSRGRDLVFRRAFPAIISSAYGWHLGLFVTVKQALGDLLLRDPDRRQRAGTPQ